MTVDIQDGYGDNLENAIAHLIDLGVVGVNLENCSRDDNLYSPDIAADTIKRVLAVAKHKDVPDFVVNGRCDVLVQGGRFDGVLDRGKRYLAAALSCGYCIASSCQGFAPGKRSQSSRRQDIIDIGKHQRSSRLVENRSAPASAMNHSKKLCLISSYARA
jgi:hypothetical protein